MPESKCPSCGCTRFEVVHAKDIAGTTRSILFVQCADCGGVVGTLDFVNMGIQASQLKNELERVLEKIRRRIQKGVITIYEIKEKLIANNRSHRLLTPQGYVIHATATPGATAENEYHYFNSAYQGASVHYFADWLEIIRTVPENEVAWHAGKTANERYLAVEMCEPRGHNPAQFEEVWKRTVWLVAEACVRYGWKEDKDIFSHRQISNFYKETTHVDPHSYLESYGRTWEELIQAISQKINELEQGNGGDGEKTMKNLILVNYGPDERAAGYLADYLQAPVAYLNRISNADLETVQTIYVVGGSTKPVEKAILISGSDRYDTCQKVLEFIRAKG